MRMTFVISSANLSGGVRAIATYAQKLQERGHQVTVVSRRRPAPPLRRRVKSLLSGNGWPAPPIRKSHFDSLDIDHQVIDNWRAVTDDDVPDADVVIATWWETAEWVMRLSPSKGTKLYFIQHHEVVFDNQPNDRVAATWRLPMQKIVCANWLKELAREEYDDSTAIHVPYGVDHDLFNAPIRGRQPVLAVGVMYSKAHFKGCDISLRAFELARQSLPDLRLLAFGTVAVSPELPLPGGSKYFRQPPQMTIKDIYGSCDAWLFASRCEGFGLPLLEAMACRTPVIATPTGAGPDVVSEGGGVLVPHEDPQAMAQQIVRICTLPDEQWRQISDAAHRTALKYDWDESARLFEAALGTTLARDRQSNAPAATLKAG